MEDISRGDVVVYNGRRYYYQPNGQSCFLYLREKDIGYSSKSCFTPMITQVRKAKSVPPFPKPQVGEFQAPNAIVRLRSFDSKTPYSGDGFIYFGITSVDDLFQRVGLKQGSLAWVRRDGSLESIENDEDLEKLTHETVVNVYPSVEARAEAFQTERDLVEKQKSQIDCLIIEDRIPLAQPPTYLKAEDAHRLLITDNKKFDHSPIELTVFWETGRAILSVKAGFQCDISWRAMYSKIKDVCGLSSDFAIVLANKDGTLNWIPSSLMDVRCQTIACKATIAVWSDIKQSSSISQSQDLDQIMLARLGLWVPHTPSLKLSPNSQQLKPTIILIGDDYINHFDLLNIFSEPVQWSGSNWYISRGPNFNFVAPNVRLKGENLVKELEHVLRCVPCATVIYCLSHDKRVPTGVMKGLRSVCMWDSFPTVYIMGLHRGEHLDPRWYEDAQDLVKKYMSNDAKLLYLGTEHPESKSKFIEELSKFPYVWYSRIPKASWKGNYGASKEEVCLVVGAEREQDTLKCARLCADIMDTKHRILAMEEQLDVQGQLRQLLQSRESQSPFVSQEILHSERMKLESYISQLKECEWSVLCDAKCRSIMPNLVKRLIEYVPC